MDFEDLALQEEYMFPTENKEFQEMNSRIDSKLNTFGRLDRLIPTESDLRVEDDYLREQ
eukprot:gene37517-46287_t